MAKPHLVPVRRTPTVKSSGLGTNRAVCSTLGLAECVGVGVAAALRGGGVAFGRLATAERTPSPSAATPTVASAATASRFTAVTVAVAPTLSPSRQPVVDQGLSRRQADLPE